MNLDEEIKKLKERGPNKPVAPAKMAKIIAASFDKASINWVGKIFWDKKFQQLADFEHLDQLEKDRIFNELLLAPLTLFMLTLEAPDINQPHDFRNYLLTVKDEIPKAHVETLKSYGTQQKYLADWEKLIQMRYEEYSQDKLKAREVMMEEKNKERALEISDLDDIHIFLPVFTVVVGCHKHILRGKTEGKDLLFKYLIKHLSRFYVNYRAIIEGGQITPFIRLQMFLRHSWNDLLDRFGKYN